MGAVAASHELTCVQCATAFAADDPSRFRANEIEARQLGVQLGAVVCPLCWHEFLWPHLDSEFAEFDDGD